MQFYAQCNEQQEHELGTHVLSLKLFDTLISPIASYAGAVWGVFCTGKNLDVNNINIYDKAPMEKINLKLCKYLLGVNKYASNAAVRGELARFPLLINILDMCTKYYTRVFTLNEDSLVRISCDDLNDQLSKRNLYPEKTSELVWQTKVKSIYNITSGLTKSALNHIYYNKWAEFISKQTCDNKLRTYAKFKKSFELENYILAMPLYKRKMFTKLRISNNFLVREKGRHLSIPKNRDIVCNFCNKIRDECTCNFFKYNRLCKNCNVVEYEKHFLMNCHLYNSSRAEFLKKLNSFINFDSADSDVLFINLMSTMNGDTEIAGVVCDFVNACFDERREYISHHDVKSSKTIFTRSGRMSRLPCRLNL